MGITSQTDNSEWRTLAKFPVLSPTLPLNKYPRAFDSFWNDNFGFRNWMLKTYGEIKINLLHAPDIPSYDIAGKDGWLFSNSIAKGQYKDFYHHIEFPLSELEYIKGKLTAERDFLKAQNIEYFLVIVPDKEVIYPEYYPYPNHLVFNIRLNQFLDFFYKNTDLNIIYLKDPLLQAKKKSPLYLYYKTDTHWNNYGAFFGYQEIMKRFKESNPTIQILDENDFNISIEGSLIGDLVRLNSKLIKEDLKISLDLKKETAANMQKLHKIYVNGDSFAINKNGPVAEGLVYFFNLSFDEVTINNVKSILEYDEIEKTHPEVVVREIIERNLYDLTTLDR